jgi:hypothetical protein
MLPNPRLTKLHSDRICRFIFTRSELPNKLEAITAVLSFVLLAIPLACVPVRETFFEPEVPGGTVSKAFCSGSLGPRNTVYFDVSEVRFLVSTMLKEDSSYHRELPLDVSIIIPNGIRIRVKALGVTLDSYQGSSVVPPQRLSRSSYEPAPNDPTAPHVFTHKELPINTDLFEGGHFVSYLLTYHLPVKGEGYFSVLLPEFAINEQDIKPLRVRFKRATSWETYLFLDILGGRPPCCIVDCNPASAELKNGRRVVTLATARAATRA